MLKKAEGEKTGSRRRSPNSGSIAALKAEIHSLDERIAAIEPEWRELHLAVPQPAAEDVPRGESSDDNVELRHWSPEGFDPARPFAEQRGFEPRSHIELIDSLGLVDFERGVKMAGSRHYVLTEEGMRLRRPSSASRSTADPGERVPR